ncbi:Thioesterase/thiol ester dehydrase-isomerase [Kockovaella imperatae]|uniref:Thioesterase/thiol ester dehydrase-isomerase n=1 Tax=Kockovaella imperatae TaxID=4999 RepID=A0A1Y1UST4_9TREE|nr:Thioesterase/thiol ester dehydrase-isomerase [Kockovaella imperatae]ORX41012.1 Thioesterase/thiol ester dehydrase-isomerase [Kockovaella imperatae]
MAACLAFVQKSWAATIAKGGHDCNVLSSLTFIHARPGHLRASLKIDQIHVNNHNTIHGGVILALTDTLTSLAISTMGYHPTGVSVNASTEFVRPGGRSGDELIGVGEVVKLGKSLAYTRITFYDPQGRVVAFGSHTKHLGAATAVVKFSSDGEREEPVRSAKL